MKRIWVANMSKDTLDSRIHVLDDVVETIIDADRKPHFYTGVDYYNMILISSELVNTSEVDKLLKAVSNANEIAFSESDHLRIDGVVVDREMILTYQPQMEGVEQLCEVTYTDGEIAFVLEDDQDTQYLVVDSD